MKGKELLHLFWVLIPILIRFALMAYPYIVSVNIEQASVNGNVLHINGTITVDPNKVPTELKYNHHENGFLPWWEKHINDVIAQSKFWRKFIHVKTIDLEWKQIGNSGGHDIIGFDVEVEVTIGKGLGQLKDVMVEV
ncbi:MAG: hypothetical protein QXV01_00315 [Candidatus Bathyarchaeia archaeon]